AARTHLEQGLAILREVGDRNGVALSLTSLGNLANAQGDYASARSCLSESLSIQREIGHPKGIAESLEAFARLMAGQRRPERAGQLWGAEERPREEIGAPLPPNEREEYDRSVASARQALGEEAFSRAWAEGRATTLEQAIELALS